MSTFQTVQTLGKFFDKKTRADFKIIHLRNSLF